MNYISSLTTPMFVGIFELDSAGTVLYTRQSQPSSEGDKNQYVVGENFFEKVADFDNVPDFRRRFKNFICSDHSTENFLFQCHSKNENFPVRVMMLRTREVNDNRSNEIVILDIRKNDI